MRSEPSRLVGGGLLLAASFLFGKETVVWVWGKTLDYLSRLVGERGLPEMNFAAIPWIDLLALACLMGGVAFTILSFRNSPAKQHAEEPVYYHDTLYSALYIGNVRVNASNLMPGASLRFFITGFNGSKYSLQFRYVDGFVRYAEVKEGIVVDEGVLTTPSAEGKDSNEALIHQNTEFKFVLDQPVSKRTADAMHGLLREGGKVHLFLNELNIHVMDTVEYEQTARLPLWDAVVIEQASGDLQAKRLIFAGRGREIEWVSDDD